MTTYITAIPTGFEAINQPIYMYENIPVTCLQTWLIVQGAIKCHRLHVTRDVKQLSNIRLSN